MPNDAGFAAVALVDEQSVQSVVRVYHTAAVYPASLAGTETMDNPMGSGPVTLTYELFVDVPIITFRGNTGNRISCDLRLIGTVSLTGTDTDVADRRIILTVGLLVRPAVVVERGGVQVRINVSDVNLERADARPADGGAPFPAALAVALNDPLFRAVLSQRLRERLRQMQTMAPPIDIPFLAQVMEAVPVRVTSVRARVFDGGLAVAVDVSLDHQEVGHIETNGDLTAVTWFVGQVSNIAVAVNGRLMDVVNVVVRERVRAELQGRGITLEAFRLSVEDGNFLITGRASRAEGGGEFRTRIRPRLGRPDRAERWEEQFGERLAVVTPGNDDIWLEAYDVRFDPALSGAIVFLVTVASVLVPIAAPGLLLGVATAIESAIRTVSRQIQTAGTMSVGASRVQRITLPGTTAPFVDVLVTQLRPTIDGFQAQFAFRPSAGPEGQIAGRTSVVLEESLRQPWRFDLVTAANLLRPEDPTVRVRWQIRRTDTNEVVVSEDRAWRWSDSRSVDFDLNVGRRRDCSRFLVTCRVYRAATDGGLEDILNLSTPFSVEDRLDRRHPYVRWQHEVITPQVEVRADSTRRLIEYNFLNRSSAIHRTQYPGRCRFAGSYTTKLQRDQLRYLDELPFPATAAGLVANRAELCDYCFFGGPTRTEPLVAVRG